MDVKHHAYLLTTLTGMDVKHHAYLLTTLTGMDVKHHAYLLTTLTGMDVKHHAYLLTTLVSNSLHLDTMALDGAASVFPFRPSGSVSLARPSLSPSFVTFL